MVARITSGASPAGALYYNKAKLDQGEACFLGGFNTLVRPGEAFSMRLAEETFAPYLQANRRTKLPTFHVSLNPSPEDKLSDGQLREIAREYMKRMGYSAQPFFVFKHTDIARSHLHVVSLRIDAEGRKLPHDFEARRSMDILRELEKEYGLHPAVKGMQQAEQGHFHKVDYRSSDMKRQVASVVRTVLRTYDCPSAAELRTLLGLFNVSLEEQAGVIRGRAYTGMIYRALTDEGIHAGVPIKAGSIGSDVGYEALQRYYARSIRKIGKEGQLDALREKVSDALRHSSGADDFVGRLAGEKITTVFLRNDEGRIRGATFIDHLTGTVTDGDRLGKAFAAYALERRFHGEGQERMVQKANTTPLAASLDAIFDLIDQRGYEEEELQRRRRRRRKRRIS